MASQAFAATGAGFTVAGAVTAQMPRLRLHLVPGRISARFLLATGRLTTASLASAARRVGEACAIVLGPRYSALALILSVLVQHHGTASPESIVAGGAREGSHVVRRHTSRRIPKRKPPDMVPSPGRGRRPQIRRTLERHIARRPPAKSRIRFWRNCRRSGHQKETLAVDRRGSLDTSIEFTTAPRSPLSGGDAKRSALSRTITPTARTQETFAVAHTAPAKSATSPGSHAQTQVALPATSSEKASTSAFSVRALETGVITARGTTRQAASPLLWGTET
mmetsp:Transcript_10632/g.19946  ORF Transcript_10632/g.19946 Transcript_10632/m.19946 type:complete len:279 (-) Transcript_10632:348-1184(-)